MRHLPDLGLLFTKNTIREYSVNYMGSFYRLDS